MFASITSTSGTLSSSASAAKSSMVSDETLTTSGGLNLAYSGTMWSMKYSMPLPGSPIDWMIPASVSAMRGVGLPSRGSRQIVFATSAPSRLRSMTSLYSQEKAPDAGCTGFCSVMSPILTERSTIPRPPAC